MKLFKAAGQMEIGLPKDILKKIFMMIENPLTILHVVPLVCKKWNVVVSDNDHNSVSKMLFDEFVVPYIAPKTLKYLYSPFKRGLERDEINKTNVFGKIIHDPQNISNLLLKEYDYSNMVDCPYCKCSVNTRHHYAHVEKSHRPDYNFYWCQKCYKIFNDAECNNTPDEKPIDSSDGIDYVKTICKFRIKDTGEWISGSCNVTPPQLILYILGFIDFEYKCSCGQSP